ncbi:hypothetical protein PORY_002412 [Pneumocystis oryctolagi]|uniref:Uncharacterized protein n=1 Tax=Pneumocystis oryctolagi TaxID=42067 RepID=A0ACB7C974_9ASCO|nr:hypothetical protein PORY_002412 [Pneumocystis oryctolagi]
MVRLSGNQLSIYNETEDEPFLVKAEPSFLQLKIERGRKHLQNKAKDISVKIEEVVDKWIGIENSVEKLAKEIVPLNGEILSGGIYVMVSGMAGLILTRKRSFPIRFITPMITSFVSSIYLFPETHKNIRNVIWKYNQTRFKTQ